MAALSFLLSNRRETIWWFAVAGFSSALALSIAALWRWRWSHLDPGGLTEEVGHLTPAFALGVIVGTKAEVYYRNLAGVRAKAILWSLSVCLFAIASALSGWTTITEKLTP